ncbi:unnamed protein product [Spirodela intermedia]|uniref:Uncharacterized protein n=1 Tax=Spirodela intermedia TaxID=51605 RepID=A0A7I8LFH8_SPIIN|nr:unnamed protein product [Spirodela intermedia]
MYMCYLVCFRIDTVSYNVRDCFDDRNIEKSKRNR